MKKRGIILLLVLLTLLSGSCGTSSKQEQSTAVQTAAQAPTEEQTTELVPQTPLPPAEDEAKSLTVVAEGKSEYIILYPKFDLNCLAHAEQLQSWIEKAYGVKLPVADDISVAIEADACEILIGKTNRTESEQLYARVGRPQDYACGVVGNKIVLIGYDSDMTQKAVNSFYGTYLSNVKDPAKPMLVATDFENSAEECRAAVTELCKKYPLY